jgi:hypothetical protein
MDIQKALDTLIGASISKQKELDSIALAIEILQDKFAAEFQSRDQAIAQLNSKNAMLVEKETELNTTKSSLVEAEKVIDQKDKVIAQKEEELILKDQQITELTAEPAEEPVETPAEPIAEEIAG